MLFKCTNDIFFMLISNLDDHKLFTAEKKQTCLKIDRLQLGHPDECFLQITFSRNFDKHKFIALNFRTLGKNLPRS